MRYAGVDEAGYGPVLGPLAVVAVAAEAKDLATIARNLAARGVRDSKRVHTPGDIGGIEAVALPGLEWLSGARPATAAAVFALLGEDASAYDGIPWMAGAATLALPIAPTMPDPWRAKHITPAGVHGCLIQPRAWNVTTRSGANKAELEMAAILALLAKSDDGTQQETVVDRLGGRKFYRAALQSCWPARMVLIDDESPAASRYRVVSATAEHQVGFWVGGEERSALTALASCIAKYARELHMHLLNHWWSVRHPGLAPTAGYPQDAARWLTAIGNDRTSFAEVLIRITAGDVDG